MYLIKSDFLRVLLFAGVFASALGGCNSTDSGGVRQATDNVVGQPQPIPTDTPSTPEEPAPVGKLPEIGTSCTSSDPNQICLGLKYVVYEDNSAVPVVTSDQALSNIDEMNSVWSQCNIAFQVDDFVSVKPSTLGLNYNTSTSGELSTIRQKLADSEKLVVVTTGTWSGTLGSGSANAWTAMPGSGLYGAILEATVGDYPNIIAHELGHYLNLGHASDASNLMNPVIYSTSTAITSSQCNGARAAVSAYWQAMKR